MPADVSYCVVNTNGREHLLACLDAIERTHPPGLEHEVLVLDNCSDDGSADAVRAELAASAADRARRGARARPRTTRTLLREAAGRYCLLLNEDSELLRRRGGRAGRRARGRPARRGGRARSC